MKHVRKYDGAVVGGIWVSVKGHGFRIRAGSRLEDLWFRFRLHGLFLWGVYST